MKTKEVEQDIVYHTPNGDVKVSAPPLVFEDPSISAAPGWLIFPDDIINMSQVICMHREDDRVVFKCNHGTFNISIPDINKTWPALQKAFAGGVKGD